MLGRRPLSFLPLASLPYASTLTDHGRADVACRLVTQPIEPSRAWQVGHGATTLWETWTGASSRDHPFNGDVNARMIKTLAGINPDPDAPGFRHILMRPHAVGGLTHAQAACDSVRGLRRTNTP